MLRKAWSNLVSCHIHADLPHSLLAARLPPLNLHVLELLWVLSVCKIRIDSIEPCIPLRFSRPSSFDRHGAIFEVKLLSASPRDRPLKLPNHSKEAPVKIICKYCVLEQLLKL